jgi:hypothetical protein
MASCGRSSSWCGSHSVCIISVCSAFVDKQMYGGILGPWNLVSTRCNEQLCSAAAALCSASRSKRSWVQGHLPDIDAAEAGPHRYHAAPWTPSTASLPPQQTILLRVCLPGCCYCGQVGWSCHIATCVWSRIPALLQINVPVSYWVSAHLPGSFTSEFDTRRLDDATTSSLI